jgi:uncharacterized protein (TIGR01777 family)
MSARPAAPKVVIAGGTGLIGSALAATLARDGYDVVVLSRRAGPPPGGPAGVRSVRRVVWDGRSTKGWLDEASGAGALVNLAGESIAGGRWSAARKHRILESRRLAAAAMLEALERAPAPPRVLLQASAVGFYGDRGDEPLDDSSAPGSGFLAETTIEWERASEPAEALGVRRVLLRTGLVLAREGGALRAMALPFRCGLGARMGSGRQWMPWIHLADEVAAISFLVANEATRGPFVLAAPAPATNAAFTRALARVLHRPALFVAPGFVLRLILGEMAILVLGGQRLAPRRLLEAGFRFRFPELAPALADLFARRKR